MDSVPWLSQARSWEVAFFLGAAVAAVALRFTLPPALRSRLRGSFLFLGLYLLLAGVRIVAHVLGAAHPAVTLLPAFVLALAAIHLACIFLFDTVARGRVPRIVQDVSIGLAFFVALMGLFNASGVALSSILTTSALLTAVIGFALHDTLGNVIGGLAMQVKQPYRVGDWVSLDNDPDHYGIVTEAQLAGHQPAHQRQRAVGDSQLQRGEEHDHQLFLALPGGPPNLFSRVRSSSSS